MSMMIGVRALHYASMLSLAGALVFAAFVAGPVLRWHGDDEGFSTLRRQIRFLIWVSLVLGLVTGLLWLVLEASSMSGKPLAQVLGQGVIPIVLGRTRFGHDWELRGILAVPLALALLLGRWSASATAKIGFWAAVALAAAELVTIAGAGHAAAGTGWAGDLHLIGDGAHLLAAGAWVGGLLPLALFFDRARRDRPSSYARAAYDATLRFSLVGILAVGTLLTTGLLNTVFLVGSVPALLGTEYGQLLMLKVALFLTMVTFAAINRRWLMPQLAAKPGAGGADSRRETLRQLQRNALIEAGLGAAVLLVVGLLGTTPPALHMEPQWPLPFRLSLDALAAQPTAVRNEAIVTGVVAFGALALLIYGLLRPRRRVFHMLAGLFVFVAVGWRPLQFMIVTAYPTSFYRSSVPLTASSIVRGSAVYAENCTGCHGTDGRGDGPLAKGTPVKPADLTAGHIFEHSDGDLFWWISHGILSAGMPGFAETLDAQQRWDVINFIHVRAAAAQPGALGPQVTAGPAPLAPDFTFEQRGNELSLRERFERGPVLLAFYELPRSRKRLEQLANAESGLTAAGLQLLALPLDAEGAGKQHTLPAFAAAGDADTAAAYRLFMPADVPCEFLVDSAGFIRARWQAGAGLDLPDEAALLTQLDRLARFPLKPEPHVHAH
jgi:putative copper export protein/mono/diheme cytochrome c family protein